MHRLTRTVRFNLPQSENVPAGSPEKNTNGEGGTPAMRGFGQHYAFEVRCVGEPDERTGYLVNIKAIDKAVRGSVVPLIASAIEAGTEPAGLMGSLFESVAERLPDEVESVGLWLTPYLMLETRGAGVPESEKGGAMGEVIIRQMHEFSAAHRLHVSGLSDDENREIFGKCNNPGGHGHNYRIEPAVAVDPAKPMRVDAIERITDEIIIERFDHKHLNDQTDEFASGSGVNPSVENIAKVCFGLLQGPIAEAGGVLRGVTVWETDRTSATFPAAL